MMLRRSVTRTVGTAARVAQPARPCFSRNTRLHAASTESAPSVANEQPEEVAVAEGYGSQGPAAVAPLQRDPEIVEYELDELDAAQEQVLSWMLDHTEAQQEEDLDEMVDYDEFGDEEYAEIHDQVEQLIDESYSILNVGDSVRGTVYDVDEEGAYVEIGEKASGFVPLSECSFAKLKTPLEVLRVGMTRDFIVVAREGTNGQVILSLAVLEASIMWTRMQQLMQEEVTVRVKVESANRGGLLVKYGPFDGFVPVGQFGQDITVENMESLVGQEIPVQFLQVNEESEKLVFSNKKVSSLEPAKASSLKMGDVVVGVIQQIKPYGAFVDIGGVTGLLHVSQITGGRITQVDKVFAEGDKVKVMILSLDPERNRITLSTKKLEPTPGDMLRDPQKVYEQADDMAAVFKGRLREAEDQMKAGPGYTDPNAVAPM